MIYQRLGLALVLALCASSSAFAADRVTGSTESGYRRLSFTFDTPAKVSATATGGVLAIGFDRKVSLDVAALTAAAPGLIASGHADADGKTLRFALTVPVKLHLSQQGARAVVDLAPADFAGVMPDLATPAKVAAKPVDPASLPQIKLRAGAYSNFTRLVFDWPKEVPYTVFPGAGKIGIRFAVPARMDLSTIAKFPPAWVKTASWRNEGDATLVEFETDPDSSYHDFRDGTHIVLDILAPKTDAAAYAPPGLLKGTTSQITKLAALNGASKDQAKAVIAAAAALSPKAAEPAKPVEAPKPDVPKPENKPADAKPDQKTAAATPPPAPIATGQVTKDGAVLTFRGVKTAAVFIRGMTAWIVLENAPAPDAAALKVSLGDFAAGLEGSSNPGLSILRLTLKAPAHIAARSDGANLKVTIGPSVSDAPIPVGLARNQADPNRVSLTTLLPAADNFFAIDDPASGDTLTIVPGAPGFGVPVQKNFADFAVLPSAAGLVVAPYTDDLSVVAAAARIIISRPGGMALTPPEMPVAGSPAALAHVGGGPSWLDLAHWGQLSGGSFLATERALNHDIATAPTTQLNYARLRLARFYLAQGFASESLGVIDLIQTSDPALKGDIQLSTMRAAADYHMGRYRDAHNELAGPVFDSDRNALLWRGLVDTALENYRDAHAELQAADAALPLYPAEWQARAHLADVEAALGLGRMDLADAALTRLPKTLPDALVLEAKLDKARITAGERRYSAAASEFAAVEQGGDERLAVRAIYYHTDAALTAGAITPARAIDALEQLRFRWRGDSLEMKVLRRLAGLYFQGGKWPQGLKTLRVATQNFSGDQARAALDDMRAAFVNLYLKGGADKMSPMDALSLFYDNEDLTPLGPDGDEMIRRMSERLVAVDLLGPAGDLLSYQVNKRLDGVAKAQVATRLAAVQLMDKKPDAAIAALRTSEITGLPDEVIHARRLLEARAFAAMKQYDNAIDLIAVDTGADTGQLRADIYWDSGNWAVAGQKLEEILGSRGGDALALEPGERTNVLRAAVAYSMANDEKSLERLHAGFEAKMKNSPDASLFAVLSQPLDMHGLAFRDAAAKIASVDTLKSFMADFNKKFAAPAKAS